MGIGQLSDGLAPTPPMGWNSWNAFAGRIDERVVLENAEAMVTSGMRDLGYRYLVVDDGWMAPRRDRAGDLVPDPGKFPHGIAAVAERVHALGLRFGIYTDAGTKTCQGLPASLGSEERDLRRFAEWGVDYVKVDWCHTEGLEARTQYAKWATAFKGAGRPMVFSICEWGGSRPWEWAGTVGHLWRTCWDIEPTWSARERAPNAHPGGAVTTVLDRQVDLHPYAGPGHWNDPDMLEVGNGDLTQDENRAHFALWAMLAAPLMAGNDLRGMSEDVRAILTSPEVIALDQDARGRQGRRLRADGDGEVWARPLAGSGRWAVALLNRGSAAREIGIGLADLGIRGARTRVRDLWQRADLSAGRDDLVASVVPHGAGVFLIEGSS
jgi:alpha-galactosidase